jgi:VWFA-related protein
VDALDTLIGPEDLVAVMTPQMSALDLAFARRTTTIEGFLARYWTWGDKDKLNPVDPVEDQYVNCYGARSPIAQEMIARRRERMTLDAFADLVAYLRGVREERKAVIAVTNGWIVYEPNPALAPTKAPAPQPIGVDPRTGKLGTSYNPDLGSYQDSCERDRFMLAQLDDRDSFRRLPDEANRANVTFYPIDPRGLPVFDSPISDPLPLAADLAFLRARVSSLRTLADNTDGIALVNSNDLAGSFRRIVSDLSSYYLLGYYSTGKLDGKFHAITVRVKRPGVRVRARRGYMASTTAAVTESGRRGAVRGSSGAAEPEAGRAAAEAETKAIEAAITPLDGYGRDVPLRLQFASGWKPDDASSAMLWVVGEIGAAALVGEAWSDGFEATATLTTHDDQTVATGRAAVPRTARTFRMALTPSAPLAAGEYVLRLSARPSAAGSIPSRETVRLTIGTAPAASGALYLRRSSATGNKDAPTADLRFRRNERLRVEVPGDAADGVSARLLDRTGKALNVPVTAAMRDDSDGSRWYAAQLALAPLAPGDYVIEISRAGLAGGESRTLAAFRIVP